MKTTSWQFTGAVFGLMFLCSDPVTAAFAPAAPDRFMIAPGDRAVRLNWQAVPGATSYNVKTGAVPAGPFSVAVAGIAATAWTHTNLANGRSNHYVISAVNAYGESAVSTALSATPSAAVLDVLPAGAKVEKLAGGFQFIEGPVWVPEEGGYLIFSDINANRLIRWSSRAGPSTFRQPSGQANGNILDHEGRLITCEHQTRRVSRTETNGMIRTLVDRFDGRTFNAPNDVAVKSDGTIWFTDPNYGAGQTQPGRYVYRFDPTNGNATVTALVTNFDQPNGICFSPDEAHLYVADSGTPRHIRVFDVTIDNRLTNGRVFTAVNPGAPDGIRAHADGRIFSSAGDGVQIFGTNGALLGRILTPEAAANLCFGGPGNRMLFITARTSLYGVTGLPDLVVTGVRRFPNNPRRGQSVIFSATVKNQGTGSTPAGVPLRVAFSIGTNNAVAWSDAFADALPPDASVVLTCNAGVMGRAWIAAGGNHTVRATVDDQAQFEESNETNNILTFPLGVPNSPDTDGDGHDDPSENIAGTDPQAADSVLRILTSGHPSGNGITVTWPSVQGKRYRVACKTGLTDLQWVDLSEPIEATNTITSWSTNLPSGIEQIFLKIRVGP